MVKLEEIKKIYDDYSYAEHGEALLSDDSNYFEKFEVWLKENDTLLKSQFIGMLRNNVNEILDDSYLSYALQKYVIWDYNKLKEEINKQIGM